MTYAYPDRVLMIFCKAAVPGQVKTRLMTELTANQAAQLHVELTHRILKTATAKPLCPVQLWCSPSASHPFFTALAAAYSIPLQEQQGFDLGERMHQAFSSALAVYSSALIIGCDCPSLAQTDLAEALDKLNYGSENDMVLAPAEDGGYALIGLRHPCPELFADIPWGTAQVLEQTRMCIRRHRIRCHELKMQWDLDTPRDLLRYRKMLADAPLTGP